MIQAHPKKVIGTHDTFIYSLPSAVPFFIFLEGNKDVITLPKPGKYQKFPAKFMFD
jgi:hypothetical protein